MLIRYPRRVTVNNKRLKIIKRQKVRYTKAMALLRIKKGNNSNSIGPLLFGFYYIKLCICLEDRNVFARFDEIPSMTL